MWRPIALALSFESAACTSPVYSQRHAALVPHAAPPLRSGAPAARGGQLAMGASSAAELRAPREGDEELGLHVPETQLRGELRFGNGTVDFGMVGLYGLARSATSLAADQPTPKGGGVVGVGTSFGLVRPLAGTAVSIGMQAELLFFRIPYVAQVTCAASCPPGVLTESDQRESLVPGVSFAVLPTYRSSTPRCSPA